MHTLEMSTTSTRTHGTASGFSTRCRCHKFGASAQGGRAGRAATVSLSCCWRRTTTQFTRRMRPLIEGDGEVQHDAGSCPGRSESKLQPCDGLVNEILKANMSGLYDDHMASHVVQRNEHDYLETPSRGVLAQWANKSWDALTADDVRSRRLACSFPSTVRYSRPLPTRNWAPTPGGGAWTLPRQLPMRTRPTPLREAPTSWGCWKSSTTTTRDGRRRWRGSEAMRHRQRGWCRGSCLWCSPHVCPHFPLACISIPSLPSSKCE